MGRQHLGDGPGLAAMLGDVPAGLRRGARGPAGLGVQGVAGTCLGAPPSMLTSNQFVPKSPPGPKSLSRIRTASPQKRARIVTPGWEKTTPVAEV